jgi:hypothetical protein
LAAGLSRGVSSSLSRFVIPSRSVSYADKDYQTCGGSSTPESGKRPQASRLPLTLNIYPILGPAGGYE